jgi:RHS repeat-associated protein
VTRFGYAGEYTDPTGFLYLRARYYDPSTAQFLSVDPLVDSTGSPYGYTDGNPLQFVDPLGLDMWDDIGNWAAGFGDTVTFGGTRWVREQMGTNDVVDTCSVFYQWGGYGGTAAQVGLAVATGGASVAYDVVGAGVSGYDAYSAFGRGDYAAAALAAAGAVPFVPRASRGALDAAANTADDVGGMIYRTGSRTDNALTDASGVSFRDSLSSSLSPQHPQVFRPGDKVWAVDTSGLPPGTVVRDGVPPGHVSVLATPDEIRGAIVDDPLLASLGLRPLDEFGSYRLPR